MVAGRDDDYRSCLFVRADLEGFAQRGWLTMLAGQSEGLSTDAGWSFKTFEVFVSGDGARVLQVQTLAPHKTAYGSSAGVSGTQVMTTAYAGAIEVQITATQRITKTYYSAGAQLIAMRQYTSPTSSVLYFLHSDHLGSVSVTTCGANCGTAGTVLSRQKFDAWGNLRSGGVGAMPTDVGFTSQRSDSTGLMYFKARYYAQSLGRFVSADTVVPGPGNPQTFNRYAYVNNNPLRFIDPSGHCSQDHDRDSACWEQYYKTLSDLGLGYIPDGLDTWDINMLVSISAWSLAGVKFTGNPWTARSLDAARMALNQVGTALGFITENILGLDGKGNLYIENTADTGCKSDMCTYGETNTIKWDTSINPDENDTSDLIHEMGHIADWRAGSSASWYSEGSPAWVKAAGWFHDFDKGLWRMNQQGQTGAISQYSMLNPVEDFADTFLWFVRRENGMGFKRQWINQQPNAERQRALTTALGLSN